MSTLVRELRSALRSLARTPGLHLLVVLTLALGIGANTAIFSILRGVVLAPLPYDEPENLVAVCSRNPAVHGFCIASPPDVSDFSAAPGFASLGLGRGWPFSLKTEEGSQGVRGGLATPAFFDVLRLPTLHGRLFLPDDVEAGKNHVAVVSHRFFTEHLGADPDAVGREIVLDGENFTVVGVLAPDADAPEHRNVEVWTPLPFDPRDEENRKWRGFSVYGRLADGVTREAAQAELRTIADRLAAAYPATNDGWSVDVVPLHDEIVGDARGTLLLFQGAVALILLIACANVANLLLARAAGRRRDLALRTALGAGRGRLIRLVVTEGLLLALAGGFFGLLLARMAVQSFLALAPSSIPRLDQVTLDGGTAAFAALAALLTAVLCSAVPAWRAVRLDVVGALKGNAGDEEGHRRSPLLGGLVSTEVGLALMLLVGAGLLARSFSNALRWQGPYDPEKILAIPTLSSSGKYKTGDEVLDVCYRGVEALRSLPGVASVSLASAGTLFGGWEGDAFVVPGHGQEDAVVARWFDVSPGHFETLGLTLVRGRDFNDADRRESLPVAVVNETLARALWGDAAAVGRRLERLEFPGPREVVGVVRDEPPVYPKTAIEPRIYWPNRQSPRWGNYFVIRTDGDSQAVAASVGARLHEIDPDMHLSSVLTLAERFDRVLVSPRFNMCLVALFAVVGLLLAAIGTYGVIAYSVARRSREIGLRLALGAARDDVVRMVLAQGLRLASIGVLLGLAGAWALEGALRSLVFGVAPTDPASYLVAVMVLAVAAVLASYLPARRAASVDPMTSIRVE